MKDQDKTKDELINELVALRQRLAEYEQLEFQPQQLKPEPKEIANLEKLPMPLVGVTKIQVAGCDVEWDSAQGICRALNLPVVLMWRDSTLSGLMSGVQAMVGTERFALALQSEGRKSVEADWQVISQFPSFEEGFAGLAQMATVAGWGDWQLISIDWTKQECHFQVRNSWEGGYQQALGVCWGSGMLAGKFAGCCSKLFETNCWSEQTAFIAKGDAFDEFIVRPSERSVEEEIEKLLVTDQATRADMAVALQKLRQEIAERQQVEVALRQSEERLRLALEAAQMGFWDWDLLTNKVAWSRNHELLFGIAPGTFSGTFEAFLEQVHPQDRKSVTEVVTRCLEARTDYMDEFRVVWPDGSIHWIEAKGQFFYDANGQAVRMIGACMDISDRKHNQQELSESEDRYRQLVELSPDAIFIQTEGKIVFINSLGAKLFGANHPGQLLGRRILDHIHPAYHEIVQQRIHQAIETKKSAPLLEEKFIRLDGTVFDVEVAASPFTYQGKLAVQVVARDITERKRAEAILKEQAQALQNQQAWLEDVLNLMPTPLLFIEPETAKVLFSNKAADQMAGGEFPKDKPAEEYHTIYYCTDATDQRIPDEQMPGVRVARGECLHGFEMNWHTPQGIRSLIVFADTLPAMHGHPATCVLVFQDITERKQAEKALQSSEHQLRAFFEGALNAMVIADDEGKYVDANASASQLFGLSKEALLGRKISDFAESNFDFSEIWNRFLDQERLTGEFRLVRPDGTVREIEYAATANFALHRHLSVLQDITERKQTDQALRESEERFRATFDQAAVGIAQVALNGRFIHVNQAVCDITGYSYEDLLQMTFQELTHPDDLEADLVQVRRVLAREINGYSLEKRFICRNGSIVWINLTCSPVWDVSNQLKYAVGIIEDISDRKRAEAERDQLLIREQEARELAEAANRMKDEFLSILSHELRTPLNSILGWSRLLCTRKMDQAATTRALQIIERNAGVQAQLIEDILDVSRIITGKLALKISSIEISRVVRAAIDTVRPAADAKDIQIHLLLDTTTDVVSGDPDRLQQVIWNLLSNAIKFTPKGGRVEVRVQTIRSQIQVAITDTGQGISADFLPYVFERFRQADSTSTRAHGGLGLGLAIVRHLVELHGGTVGVESPGVGKGATFTIRFPIMAVHRAAETQEVATVETASNGELHQERLELEGLKILVVDDEADARELLITVLEESGAQVRAVGSASEAMRSLEEFKPDILVSDIGMPGEDGYTLLRKIRALKPENGSQIPAAALTAYARAEDRTQALLAGFQIHISKPVEPAELIAVVASLAGRTGS